MQEIMTKEDIEQIKELFYKIHNNQTLSNIEDEFLEKFNLSIINNGSDVSLFNGEEDREEYSLVSIPYYTVGSNTDKDYMKVDEQFEILYLKWNNKYSDFNLTIEKINEEEIKVTPNRKLFKFAEDLVYLFDCEGLSSADLSIETLYDENEYMLISNNEEKAYYINITNIVEGKEEVSSYAFDVKYLDDEEKYDRK